VSAREIYLDYNATTALDQEVLDEMLPWMTEKFWNAASAHAGGRQASQAVEKARESIAASIGALPREIVFTSGATEADNAALKGAFESAPQGRNRVIVGATEHKAVLDTAEWLADRGADVTAAPVSRSGLIDEDALDEMLDETVALVSIMSANNETGVIAPIARLAEAAHEVGALFHADATQTVGKVPVDLESLGVDLASFSAHKLYGPKGVGALYVRRGVDLDPLLHGGGHERGLRSGTLNVPGIVGFGRATELASIVMSEESTRQSDLTRRLVEGLGKLPNVTLIASESERLPNTANLRFGGVDGEAVMANAPNLLVSSGSACTSMAPEPSHVLCAMGLSAEEAQECLRFSLGRPTTPSDIDQAIEMIVHSVERVRSFDMVPAR